MHTQRLAVDDLTWGIDINIRSQVIRGRTYRRQVQVVKDTTTCLPYLRRAVLLLILICAGRRMHVRMIRLNARTVESIDLGDLSALMIPSQESDLVWISAQQSQSQLAPWRAENADFAFSTRSNETVSRPPGTCLSSLLA